MGLAEGYVFDSDNIDGSGSGTIKICCMHDPYDLCCPVCGQTRFSNMDGAFFTCEGCGIQICLFPDEKGCRFLMEVQGA